MRGLFGKLPIWELVIGALFMVLGLLLLAPNKLLSQPSQCDYCQPYGVYTKTISCGGTLCYPDACRIDRCTVEPSCSTVTGVCYFCIDPQYCHDCFTAGCEQIFGCRCF